MFEPPRTCDCKKWVRFCIVHSRVLQPHGEGLGEKDKNKKMSNRLNLRMLNNNIIQALEINWLRNKYIT